jgi:GT2 family glycosyltransferase
METPPAVSVIVPTHNRKEELQGLISSLDEQTIPASQYEIIVIDDGSSDDTLAFLQSLVRNGKDNLVFFYQKNQGPGAARNRGVSLAKGTILVFTDTDCRPFPDWLENLIKPFSDKTIGAVGGAEAYSAEDSLLTRAIHVCMTSSMTTGGMRGTTGKKLARYYPRTFNMAISQEAFKKTGGFKPLFHGEDIELSFRIKRAGFKLLFIEQAHVHHRRRTTIKQFFRQLMKMGEARVTLVRMHPEMLEPLHVVPAAVILAVAVSVMLSPVFQFFLSLLGLILFLGLGFSVLAGLSGYRKTHNIQLSLLVPVLFIVQQSAYGTGFYKGLWKWVSTPFLPDEEEHEKNS